MKCVDSYASQKKITVTSYALTWRVLKINKTKIVKFYRTSIEYGSMHSHSGLAGPWNRGIIAHQTPHFRRPPKHVNNKGPSVLAQTFCTAWFISLENLHIYSKTYVFSNTFEGFRPKCTFRGCFNKYRRTFIVYMFRQPPEVWSLMSDNTLISGTGKVGIGDISSLGGSMEYNFFHIMPLSRPMRTFLFYCVYSSFISMWPP